MYCQRLGPEDKFRRSIVVVIIIAWLIVTIRSGFAWLSPIDITFFALLLGRPAVEAAAP